MTLFSTDWPAPDCAIDEAARMAKKLGHAAVILRNTKLPDDWKACDSWAAIPDGFKVHAYVSRDGRVRRLA